MFADNLGEVARAALARRRRRPQPVLDAPLLSGGAHAREHGRGRGRGARAAGRSGLRVQGRRRAHPGPQGGRRGPRLHPAAPGRDRPRARGRGLGAGSRPAGAGAWKARPSPCAPTAGPSRSRSRCGGWAGAEDVAAAQQAQAALVVLLRLPVPRRRRLAHRAALCGPRGAAGRGRRRPASLLPRVVTSRAGRGRSASSTSRSPPATKGSWPSRSPRPYGAGHRGFHWLKLKSARTLDLLVLAVEWGSGRRKGWLSNLHLGARDPESGQGRDARQDLQGPDRRDAALADREAPVARGRAATSGRSTCAPSSWSRSPSTTSRSLRAIPRASPCASRGSSATARTSPPPRPTPSTRCRRSSSSSAE